MNYELIVVVVIDPVKDLLGFFDLLLSNDELSDLEGHSPKPNYVINLNLSSFLLKKLNDIPAVLFND